MNTGAVPILSRLTVDAGVSGTGLSFWSDEDWKKLVPPIKAFNIYARTGSWEERAAELGSKFRVAVTQNHVGRVYIEFPEFMTGLRGNAAAVKGDLGKLTFVVGIYARVCHELDISVDLIPVSVWIGQLPKEVVKNRIRSKLPGIKLASHSWDSTGLGLFVKGFFG